ncbi:MAG: insulinase family protein [Anaeromyxobacter sp.]|nr:insulinase family protein [Anaeromyxobacter sp.]
MDHGLDAQVLPSGLQLAVFQVPGQRDVTVWLSLGGGAADEPEERSGLATVAVRAAALARRSAGGATLIERLFSAGAFWDGTALPDETSISVRCRPAALPEVLAALSALLEDPAGGLDEEAVAVAREELATGLERDAGKAEAAVREVIRLGLQGTPFERRPPTPALARSITLEEVAAFLRASYRPERAVLGVASARDAEPMAAAVVGDLRGRAAGDPASPVAPAPSFSSEPPPSPIVRQEISVTGGEKPRLILAWRAPGFRFKPAADMGARALRDTLGSRAARPDLDAKVTHVDAHFMALDRAGLLLVEVGLERLEDAPAVRKALLEEAPTADSTWRYRGPGADAAWRQSLRLERELAMARGWVGPVGRLVRTTGSADVPTWLDLNERAQVGPSVSAWLDAWVDPGPAVIATVAPAPSGLDAAGSERAGQALPPEADERQLAWPMAHSLVDTAAPGPAAIASLLGATGFTDARRVTLSSGLELVVLRRPASPVVALKLFLPGGARTPGEWRPARRALDEARRQLQREGFGLAPAALSYTDGVVIQTYGATAWLPAVVEAVACWSRGLSAPRTRPPGIDDDLTSRASEAVQTGGALPPAYGGTTWTEAFLDRVGDAEGAVVVLVGDVDPVEGLRQLQAAFGRFERRTGERRSGPATPTWPKTRRVILRDVPGAALATATVLLRLPDDSDAGTEEAAVLDHLLTDRVQRTFGSRGLEVGSRVWGMGRAAFQALTLEGPPGLVAPASRELLRQLGRLAEEGPAGLDVEVARWSRARVLAFAFDTPHEAVAQLQMLSSAGLPFDHADTAGQRLAQVDLAAVRRYLAKTGIGAEGLLFTGDAAALLPLLQKEGLTPEVLAAPAPPAPQVERR